MQLKDFRIDILTRELELCLSKVNHFDNLRLRMRQTGIALWIAVLGFGLKEAADDLLILAILLPVPFWVIDASYRRYQRGWNLRLRAVRDFIRDGEFVLPGNRKATLNEFLQSDEAAAFPTIDFWARRTVPEKEHRRETSFLRNFFNRNHLMIYGGMSLISTLLAFWIRQ